MSLLLCAVIISALCVSALALKLDYSSPSATSKQTLSSADILELSTGIKLSEAERSYLEAYGADSITYSPLVPTSNVTSEYDSQTKSLKVTARVYEYTANTGFKIKWTPVYATVSGEKHSMTVGADGKYTVTLTDIDEGGEEYVRVMYSSSIGVAQKTVNGLLNKTYSEAPLWASYGEYLEQKREYDARLALYQKYISDKNVYDEKYIAYQKYLKEYADYEDAEAIYQEYLAELEVYNKKHAEYIKYLDDKKKYDANLALYNEYVANYATVKDQIAIIDGIQRNCTSYKRSLYRAIMTDTVTTVLANKDAIANELTGLDGAVVDEAGLATENLRELFDGYFALTEEEDKYAYYSLNYEAFKENFSLLFKCLDKLYRNAKVRVAIRQQNKIEKYEILLAQLYYTVNAISDTPVSNYDGTALFDSTYRIDGDTPLKIHEGEVYIVDKNNAEPLPNGYPQAVEKPVIVTVDEPQKPTPVLAPVKPEEVSAPGDAPEIVERPTAPRLVEPPFSIATPENLPKEITDVISAYRNGELSERSQISSDALITLEAFAVKRFLNVDEIVINFYGTNGEKLDTVNAERTSYVEFSGMIPTKPEDDSATYTFVGWQDENGNPVDMTSVNCQGVQLNLYPLFEAEYKLYDVTWSVNGNRTVTRERLGVTPVCPVVPEKADVDSFMYVFAGWRDFSGAIVEGDFPSVSADESQNLFTAEFERRFIVPYSNGSGALVSFDGTRYFVDSSRSPDKELNLSHLIPRAAGNGGITVSAKNYTLEFSYSEVIAMSEAGVSALSVSSAVKGSVGYSFAVNLYGTDGERLDVSVGAVLTLPYTFSDPANMRMYYETADGRVPVRAIPDSTSVTVSVICGVAYHAVTEYAIDVMKTDEVYIGADKSAASAGDRVRIDYAAPVGIKITSVYLIKENGEREEIVDSTFIMPASGVSVGIEYERISYTVTFVADGKVISVKKYFYGDIPTPPTAPKKASDSEYNYKFLDWEPVITAVTEDKIYEALYLPTEIPEKEQPDGLIITDSVLRIIVTVLFIGVYGAVVILPVLVIALVKLVRRVRRKSKKS